jgi:hypothetical protein
MRLYNGDPIKFTGGGMRKSRKSGDNDCLLWLVSVSMGS